MKSKASIAASLVVLASLFATQVRVWAAGFYPSSSHMVRRSSGGSYYYPPPADPQAAERERRAELELKKQLEVAQSEQDAQRIREQIEIWRNFVPEDPYRGFNGATVYAKGNGWVKFGGKIIEIRSTGILVDGTLKSLDEPFQPHTYRGKFLVSGFPYAPTNGVQVLCAESGSDFTAHDPGDTGVDGTNVIRKLEYGLVVAPPPPSSEIVNYVVKAAETQTITEASTLSWNQEQADKGDAFGQLRMGERYLIGDGVEKDLAKAREYLNKAALQGNANASNELQNLKP